MRLITELKRYNPKRLVFLFLLHFIIYPCDAQIPEITGIPAEIDFSKTLRAWDGFGFNYVETAHTYDYSAYPQDYGGFSLLDARAKEEIINLVFGENGLKISLLKMFLDPLHQKAPGSAFNHELSTKNMLEFVHMGNKKTLQRDAELSIITTLYGPPGWMTLQKFDQGRDLDPAQKDALAGYMIDWLKYLRYDKKLPVKYLSLHNEGEDWMRWAWDGKEKGIFDYNLYWPHQQVNAFLKYLPEKLKKEGLQDVGLTNGEPSNWYRFFAWGCAAALYDDKQALANLGLITSHGFYADVQLHRWYANHNSVGSDLLRGERPELHAWVTSCGWGKMDCLFIREIYGNIYQSKVNGLIPWAGIQRPSQWEGRDPNAGCAIQVSEDGRYEILKGYYFYKQVTTAGQPGMAVARTWAMDTQTPIIAFASNNSKNTDAFVIINWDKKWDKILEIDIKGSKAKKFHGFRTNNGNENYQDIGIIELHEGKFSYTAPIGTVSTFFALESN